MRIHYLKAIIVPPISATSRCEAATEQAVSNPTTAKQTRGL
jgi:hypothetical protein